MIMLFPSTNNPLLQLFITLKDGTVHRLARNLSSTLDANTRLTLNVVIGNIFRGEEPETLPSKTGMKQPKPLNFQWWIEERKEKF